MKTSTSNGPNRLQIKELVGEFTTSYVAGQSRVVNIQRIAELTRGAIIEPGGEFSINDYVGRRTHANGFVDAGVIEYSTPRSAVGSAGTQPPSSRRSSQASTLVSTSRTRSTSIGTRTVEERSHPNPDLEIINNTPYGVLVADDDHVNHRPTLSTKWVEAEQTGQSERRQGVRARVSPPNAPAPDRRRSDQGRRHRRYRPEGCGAMPPSDPADRATTTTSTVPPSTTVPGMRSPLDGDIVIGAGPAGAAAATLLARGRDVHVFDRATFPRQVLRRWACHPALRKLMHSGFDPSAVDSWQRVDDVVIRPRGTERRYPLPQGEFLRPSPDELRRSPRRPRSQRRTRSTKAFSSPAWRPTSPGLTLISTATPSSPLRSQPTACGPPFGNFGVGVDGYRGDGTFRQYPEGEPRATSGLWCGSRKTFFGYVVLPLDGDRANIGFGIQQGGDHAVGDMKALWETSSRPIRDLRSRAEPKPRTKPGPAPPGRPSSAHRSAHDVHRGRRRHRPDDRRRYRSGAADRPSRN